MMWSEIKKARYAAGLTVAQLADKLGVTRQTIYQWESGRSSCPPDKVPEYAQVLAVCPSVLAGWLADDYERRKR